MHETVLMKTYEDYVLRLWKLCIMRTILIKTILMKNNYPPISCIKSFLNKLYTPKVTVQNVPKRNVFVKLPFLGITPLQIRKKLQKSNWHFVTYVTR